MGFLDSILYNSISIFCAFIVAFNIIPLTTPVLSTMKTTTRAIWTALFAFVLFSNYSQDYNPDMMILCPIAAVAGLLLSYRRFKAPKTPQG